MSFSDCPPDSRPSASRPDASASSAQPPGLRTGPGGTLVAGCGPRGVAAGAVAVDINEDYVRQARREAPDALWVVADIRALPLKSGRFSQVVCEDVFEHIEEKETAAAELARVAAPGARLRFSAGIVTCDRWLARLSRTYRRVVLEGYHAPSTPAGEYLRILAQHFSLERVWYPCSAYVWTVIGMLDPLGITITEGAQYEGKYAPLLLRVAGWATWVLQPLFNLAGPRWHETLSQVVKVEGHRRAAEETSGAAPKVVFGCPAGPLHWLRSRTRRRAAET